MKIITRIESLRACEHEATVSLISALLECDRSQAHVTLGYNSMWEFLVQHLNYSNAAASRRYKALKCAQRFPQVLEMLRKHETNLSALAAAEVTLARAANPQELLGEIKGKSQPQVAKLLARHNPQPKKRETVRHIAVKPKPRPAPDIFAATSAAEVRTSEVDVSAPESVASNSVPELPAPTSAPLAEDRVQLSFSVTSETYARFEQAKAILSRKLPKGLTLEAAFEELLEFYLKHKRPESAKRNSEAKKPTTRSSATTRHIPAAIRREVFARDSNRCTYAGPTGKACNSTHDLEVDHIQPWAMGGDHEVENLRLLCAKHNRHRNLSLKEPSARYAGLGDAHTSAAELDRATRFSPPPLAPRTSLPSYWSHPDLRRFDTAGVSP
jgi:5-methylcytosine-specific restriction endonuclease McrA